MKIEFIDDYVEVYSPGGTSKIKIRKPKIPIISEGGEKTGELMSIKQQILSKTVIPDFGYSQNGMLYNKSSGWNLFYDYCKKEP